MFSKIVTTMKQQCRHKIRGDNVENLELMFVLVTWQRSDYVLLVKWYGHISCVLDMKTIRPEMEDEKSEIRKATSSGFFFK